MLHVKISYEGRLGFHLICDYCKCTIHWEDEFSLLHVANASTPYRTRNWFVHVKYCEGTLVKELASGKTKKIVSKQGQYRNISKLIQVDDGEESWPQRKKYYYPRKQPSW